MRKSLLCGLIAASSLVVAGQAFAGSYEPAPMPVAPMDNGYWYVGGGINVDGQTDWSQKDENTSTTAGAVTSPNSAISGTKADYDGAGVGWDIFVGRQVNKFFGLELSYVSFSDGCTKYTGGSTANNYDGATSEYSDMWAISLMGVGRYPIFMGNGWSFNAYAKGGVAYFDGEYFDKLSNGNKVNSESFSNTGFSYGAGLELDFNKIAVRADYTRITRNGNVEDDPNDFGYIPDLVSLNVMYKFGQQGGIV